MGKCYWGSRVSVYEFVKLIPNSAIYENPNDEELLDIINLGFEERNKVIILSESKLLKKIGDIECYILCFQEIEGQFLSPDFLFNEACQYYKLKIDVVNKEKIITTSNRIVSTLERIEILGNNDIEKVLSIFQEDPIAYIRYTLFKLKNWKTKKYDKDFGKFDSESKYFFLKLFLCSNEDLFKKTGETNITVYCKYVIKLVLSQKL